MILKTYRISDIGKVVTGKTPKTSIKENFENGTIPFYTPEDVANGFGIRESNKRFITERGFAEIHANTLKGDSVLVGCIGSDMGNVAYTSKRCATNQQINSITDFKSFVNPLYIYYLLSTKKSFLRSLAGSTTTPILPKSIFEDIEIKLPERDEQNKVVGVLSSLDKKIALNRAINDNLEAMARQLYDYWFVQFDFPDKNGKPYKSSGGKMVWSEVLKKFVPYSWQVENLNKWLDIKSGYAFKSNTYVARGQYKVITIKNVQNHRLDTSSCDYIDEIPKGMKDWCKLSINDRLISLTGNCGRLCLVTEDNLLLNQRVGLISCSNDYLNFAYLLLSSKEYQMICDNLANGAAQANLSPIKLCESPSVLPPVTVVRAFNIQILPIVSSFIQNEKQIRTLTKQRDELLPLLMNGQVSVNYHLRYKQHR